MWLNLLTVYAGQCVRPYWRVGLRGDTGAVPTKGPLLLASNHASFLDPWFIGLAFQRPVRFLITRNWYDRSPSWRRFFRACGTIPAAAEDPSRTIDEVCAALAQGHVVGIFPEGRISGDGLIQRFRPGLSRIAARSGAPVLPVGLRGDFESLPRQRRLPRPVKVTVHLGELLRFPGAPFPGIPPREESRTFQECVVREICRLAGQADRVDGLLARGASRSAGPPAGSPSAQRGGP